jgi:hypothetical protein
MTGMASVIAVIVAVLCLIGLVYVALFLSPPTDRPPRKHPPGHYNRWEDRL